MKKVVINARVFDGRHSQLKEHASIVIEGNLVKEICFGEISLEQFDEVIDAKNRVVIPGLSDMHVHISHNVKGGTDALRIDEAAVRGAKQAYEMLLRGFTTLRDAGGIVYGIKHSIDTGFIDGPRIFPSNAYISQTCGHGDTRSSRAQQRLFDDVYTSPSLMAGGTVLVDGVPQMLKAVREQLFLGASQIKLMAGGGISSQYDPLFTVQFTFEEMKAAVDAAADFGTYVMAHLYTPQAMKRAAKAGIKSFEHASLMDEETAKIIKTEGIWVMPGPQAARGRNIRPDVSEETRKKAILVRDGEEKATEYINKYDIPIVFGSDSTGDPERTKAHQLDDFRFMKKRFGSLKGLISATGNVCELNKLTTYQNPYPEGKIGVLEEGAFADLIIVNGNPLEDLDVIAQEDNLLLIMKDAKIYKNTGIEVSGEKV